MTQGPEELRSFTDTQVNSIFRDSPQNAPTELSTPYSEGIIPGLPYGRLPTQQLPPLIRPEAGIPVVSFAQPEDSRPHYGRFIIAGVAVLVAVGAAIRYGGELFSDYLNNSGNNNFNPKPITVTTPTRSASPRPTMAPSPTEMPTVTVTATATTTKTAKPSVIQTTVTATPSTIPSETVLPPTAPTSPSPSSPNTTPSVLITTPAADAQGLNWWQKWSSKDHKDDQPDMSGFEQELVARLQANGINATIKTDAAPAGEGALLISLNNGKNGVSYGVHEHMFDNPFDPNVDKDKTNACVSSTIAASAVQQWRLTARDVSGPNMNKLAWNDAHAPSLSFGVNIPRNPNKKPQQTSEVAGQVSAALVAALGGWQNILDSCKQ